VPRRGTNVTEQPLTAPTRGLPMDWTPEEQRCYDEGRAACEKGEDFFSSPYMKPPRNLSLLCAWSTGYVEAEESRAAPRSVVSVQS
jgi:hypothetical protein